MVKWLNFEVFLDLACPKPARDNIFLLFALFLGLGGAVKAGEKKDDLLS